MALLDGNGKSQISLCQGVSVDMLSAIPSQLIDFCLHY